MIPSNRASPTPIWIPAFARMTDCCNLLEWRLRTFAIAGLLLTASLYAACIPGADEVDLDRVFAEALGGDTTAFTAGRNAFELSARNLTNEDRRTFEIGDSFFTQNWVAAPSSTAARDGLGPTFNAQSCSSCHAHDGRARPPSGVDDPVRGLLLRLSTHGPDGPTADPVYGGQLQDRAIIGVEVEGRIGIEYEELPGAYPDGTTFSLRRPMYSILDPASGPVDPDIMVSPRIAPAIMGVGLLEAIPEDKIRGLADPDDVDGDGVSGRPNEVWDIRRASFALGRFGWKSNQPTLEQQAAGAFSGDIGITSSLFPDEDCPMAQKACAAAINGGSPEIPDERLRKVTFYVQTLAVPAMRDADEPEVERGARLFMKANCAACHTPRHVTGDSHPADALHNQVIFPYTDLLLHDMGERLADDRPDGLASGSEWRTPPLWGIGLVETVNGHTMFLHDGRARNMEEAILWHGGEALESRNRFMGMSKSDRDALLRFLRAL